MLGLYDFTMPGGVKLNHASLQSQGQTELKEVEEEIKLINPNSSFFVLVKK